MTDPRTCPHETTEPVYAYLHHGDPQAGDPVLLANGGKPVARICSACQEQLTAAWGCTDCEWVEDRRLSDPVPQLLLGRPCQEHSDEADWGRLYDLSDAPPPVPVMRLLLVPTVADVRAPTTTELNAGQDLTPYLVQPPEETA